MMLSKELEEEFRNIGLEIYYFKIKWYNESVEAKYWLKYHDDTLAFLVISNPSWFENSFLPFLADNNKKFSDDSNLLIKDPIDQCMTYLFQMLSKKISQSLNTQVDTIHDFEIEMPFRRPKVVLQTAAHISGAAYYYKSKNENYRLGVCIHPQYGGWFGLRGVMILKDILLPDLIKKLPQNTIPDQSDQEELLKKFNEEWSNDQNIWRDFIPVKSRYSQLQFDYFNTKPKDRLEFIHTKIYPMLSQKNN